MRSTSTAIALIMAFGTTPALAQWAFDEIDADRNTQLAETEFEQVSRDLFARMDMNRDERLDRNELSAGRDMLGGEGDLEVGEGETFDWANFHARLFDAYDRDNDSALNESEFGPIAEADLATTGATGAAVFSATAAANQTIQADRIIPLNQWRYDDLYQGGFSVENLMDEAEVYGVDGEEIGSVEDVIFGADGRVLSVIAEVGGFWDIGDTHVSIPWDRVEFRPGREGINVPVDEDNVDEYGLFESEFISAASAEAGVRTEVDDLKTGPRAFRATELIGDFARLRDDQTFQNYGYINDLIVRDGELAAVLVNPDYGFGARGVYGYPYYGYGTGWTPGGAYYDLPYERDEVGGLEPFDYERFDG